MLELDEDKRKKNWEIDLTLQEKKKVKDKRIGKWITLFINKQSKLKQDCFPQEREGSLSKGEDAAFYLTVPH